MHLKRNKAPKTWPVPRKGTKYLAVPLHNIKDSFPLIIALRDILKLAKNKKEAKKILKENKVKVNNRIVKNEKFPLMLFDILSLEKRNFKVISKNKKFDLKQIDEEESGKKIAKVIGKKVLKKGRIQINLSDGRNFFIKEKTETGNSVIIDLEKNKIEKILELRKGCKVLILKGKHVGKEGIAEEIDEKKKIVYLKTGEEKLNVGIESVLVLS